ncbi:MAG: hypothetical protein E7601_06590 [Ruminococcaceae bacterium]|nr:hypothetical protein [Oscillospiraceae bacterium]
MKRTLSFILSVVMVATLALTLFVGVGAAKDGDVLWEANFKGDSKFAPAVLTDKATTADTVVTPSADGKSVNVTFTKESSNSYAWGGAIDGLKITADTRYTVDVVFKTSGDGDNCGVTAVTGNAADPFAGGWYTLYGKTTSTFTLNKSGTSDAGFFWKNLGNANDADGYATFKIEVWGYNVRVYALTADGTYKLGAAYPIAYAEHETANIACGMFAYVNAGKVTTLDIKSFKVTQGCALTKADLADESYKTVGLYPTYAAAKNGDLVWSANFKGDANFVPATTGSADARLDTKVDVSADGKALTLTGSTYEAGSGGTAGKYFYASPIKGLVVREDTEYTIEFKLKNEAQYGGAIFYCNEDDLPTSYVSFYGGLQANEDNTIKDGAWTIAEGSQTTKFLASKQFSSSYVKIHETNPDVVLTDTYFDMKVELDGYVATVYYKTADGYKELITYQIDDLETTLACGYYNYQPYAKAFLKDFNVYKGLTVSNDYSKVEPDPTPTPTPNPGTGDNTAIAMVLAVISITSLGAVAVAKKAR